jgi:hypothetical protein
MGLMFAIVLWGTSYKLSLYHPHPAPSMRTQVAKLWVENRASYVLPVQKVKDPAHAGADLHVLDVQSPPARISICFSRIFYQPPAKVISFAGSSIPSRSPPSSSLSLG